MKILVLNCGSSSVKYKLLDMATEFMLAEGTAERVGLAGTNIIYRHAGKPVVKTEGEHPEASMGFEDAIQHILNALVHPEYGAIKDLNEIDAVGHRVLHGGTKFSSSVLVNDDVIAAIVECIPLGPLHNPANLRGIEAIKHIMPDVPNVAVFDTAFHQTMPPKAYVYALPYDLYEEYGVRRYGFHGTSHRYVSSRAAKILNRPIEELKMVTCHLGNGASAAAIDGGKCVDTTMGLTPLAGLVMGTRCGDIDPAIVSFIMKHKKIGLGSIDNYLNKKSGVLGVSGISHDLRDVAKAADNGDERAQLALDIYSYKVKKTIGMYAAAMGGLDVIVFTGGVGENYAEMRAQICEGLEFMGVELDSERNKDCVKEQIISKDGAGVATMVVSTNEELVIAKDTEEIVKKCAATAKVPVMT